MSRVPQSRRDACDLGGDERRHVQMLKDPTEMELDAQRLTFLDSAPRRLHADDESMRRVGRGHPDVHVVVDRQRRA
jgi:hypothetical protein